MQMSKIFLYISVICLISVFSFSPISSQTFNNRYIFDDIAAMDFSNIAIKHDTIITIGRGATFYYPYPTKLMVSKFDFSGEHLDLLMEYGDSLTTYLPYYGTSTFLKEDKMLIVGGAGDYFADDLGFAALVDSFSSFNWLRTYEPTDSSAAYRFVNGIILENDSMLYLASRQSSFDYTINAISTILIKADNTGEILWEKKIEATNKSYIPEFILSESDTSFLIGMQMNQGENNFRSAIFKVNGQGDTVFEWINDSNETFSPRRIIKSSDGGIIFVCKSFKEMNQNNYPLYQGYICKLDSSFNKEWELKLGYKSYGTKFLNMTETYDGNYVAVGAVSDTFQTENVRRQKGWLVKFNDSGEVIWDRKIYSNANQYSVITDIVEAEDHSLIACGLSQSNNEDYPQRGWLLKLDEWGCLDPEWCGPNPVVEIPEIPLNYIISPNPASEYFRVSLSENSTSSHLSDFLIRKIVVYSIVGERMFATEKNGVFYINIETKGWLPGMYVVMVNDKFTGKIFVE